MASLLVWYLLTHGRLNIPSASKESVATYVRLEDGVAKTPEGTEQSGNIVPTGTYSVSIKDKDGNRIITNADVARLLMETTVDVKPTPRHITTIARNSLSDLIYTSRGLSSYEGASFRQLDPSNITNDSLKDFELPTYPDFIEKQQVNRSILVGFENASNGVQPLRYDAISGKVDFYPLLSDVDPKKVYLNQTGNTFALFDKGSGNIVAYDISSSHTTSISLDNIDKVSENEGRPVFSVTSKRLAILIGPDFVASNDNDMELIEGDHTVKIFDTSSKKIVKSLPLSSASVRDISLSSNGTYIAITTSTQTGIYNVKKGKLIFSVPHSVEDFRWLNDDKFIFTSTSEGIFSGSMKDQSAQTLVSYKDVRPTSISFLEGEELYFTGFNGTIPNADYPDAYKVSLSAAANKADFTSLRDFPHSGRGFYTDQLNGVVIVQLTRYTDEEGNSLGLDAEAKARAVSYVRSKLPDYPVGEIKYVYVNLAF